MKRVEIACGIRHGKTLAMNLWRALQVGKEHFVSLDKSMKVVRDAARRPHEKAAAEKER